VTQAGKYFLEDRICLRTVLAGFGTFPRFARCQRVKPSAVRILAFTDDNAFFGCIALNCATTIAVTYIARCASTQMMRRPPRRTHSTA